MTLPVPPLSDGFELSPQQARLWHARRGADETSATLTLACDPPCDADRLRRSLHTLIGLHDVLSSVGGLPTLDAPIDPAPFRVEIVAERAGTMPLVTGVPVTAGRAVADVGSTDIVLVPSLLSDGGRWEPGRHPELVDWIARMHAGGALLASACSGLFPLAETGLLDGREATADARTLCWRRPKT